MLETRKDLFTEKTNREISILRDALETNRDAFDEIDQERELAIENAAGITLPALDILNDELRNKKHLRHLEQLELCTKQHNLAIKCLEECREAIAHRRELSNTARKNAAKKLKSAGISIQSMQAWPDNQPAAQNQFNFRLQESITVRAADAAVEEAEQMARNLKALVTKTKEQIEQSELAIKQLASAILK